MEIRVFLEQKGRDVFAEGIYNDGKITVLSGGKISGDFANHVRGGRMAKKLRDNPEYVDSEGRILKDCSFSSPSTAAQFVTGRSTNGYEIWKVEKKKNLGKYLEENNLR